MRTGPTNQHMQALITQLKRESYTTQTSLWHRVACDLERPTRNRRAVNISRINRNTKTNDTIIVPGKVLGSGNLDHSVTVAAWDFSQGAREQIIKSKGTCISIQDLLKKDPKAKNVRIIG